MSCAVHMAGARSDKKLHCVGAMVNSALSSSASFDGRGNQSEDFLLLEPLSDFEDLSLDLLPESDLLDDSLAFLSAAASLL